MAIYDRECRVCGKSFKGGPRAWYCPECRKERGRERSAKYRKNGYNRQIGSVDVCKNCGKEYVINSGLQKYCPDCQEEMHKKLDNEQGTKYYHTVIDKNERNAKRRKHWAENAEEINAKRREKRKANKGKNTAEE